MKFTFPKSFKFTDLLALARNERFDPAADAHVFRLYALTPEEIQLVTEATQK